MTTAASQTDRAPTPPLPDRYRPGEHEPRVRARWEASRAFAADPERVTEGGARPYTILIPPPNVTAALHLGHALNNTLQDVLVRAHRMRGYETLWMPGTDHAGIATQAVVERRLLADEGKRRTDLSREAFVARVQAFKDEYEARITEQLKRMGCSCDWARQRFTMDPVCARAVQHAFFRLFRDGLIYRGKRLVNWDPATQTALADDEVEMREVEGRFYYLRYPLVHPPTNPTDRLDVREVTWSELAARGCPGAESLPEDDEAFLTVATTRPETYIGDTAVAVNPHDPRAPSLRGLRVQLPLIGRVIPIVEDEYVVMPAGADDEAVDPKARYATGFLKVTPAHDPNDYELGVRHSLERVNVMAPDASISEAHGWEREARGEGGHIFVGKSREEARELVVREFKARGLLEAVRPYAHSVGHSYRSHVAIEPYLSDQWYVRVTDDRMRGAALRAMAQRSDGHSRGAPATGDGDLRFHPERYARTFELWHENLRDWCISRQLWWGHRIPVWTRTITVPRGQAPGSGEIGRLGLDRMASGEHAHAAVRVRTESGEEADARELLRTDANRERTLRLFVCLDGSDPAGAQRLVEAGFVQDPDVLDTWFSSALWPMSTLGWPDGAAAARDTGIDDFPALLGAFNPSTVLCTAREIITLWVSRMVMFNRYFLGEDDGQGAGRGRLPFRDVFIHAMIQDGEGRKMSKSLGNGVDPIDIIETHGADALRFTLCHMTTHTQDVRMPVEPDAATGRNTSPKFDLGRNFVSKLYNATRFLLDRMGEFSAEPASGPPRRGDPGLADVDRWMLSRLAGAVARIDAAIESYSFSEYAAAVYDLLWRDYCDWYLEAVKPTLATSPAQQAVLRVGLDVILRVLHPVCPFVTEVLFERVSGASRARVAGVELAEPRVADDAGGLLCSAGWPRLDPAWLDPEAEARFDRVRALVEEIRRVRAQHQVPPKRSITLHAPAGLVEAISSAEVVRFLARVERITAEAPSGPAVAFTFEATELRLSDLADRIEASAERERVEKQVQELERSRAALAGRLSNPGYASKAPAHLVAQTREQLERVEADLSAARSALERLS